MAQPKKTLEYPNEPDRKCLSALLVRKDAPFNAEPTPPDLVKHYITPIPYFFCRSHGPIPDLQDDHTFVINGLGVIGNEQMWSVKDIKQKYEKKQVMMAMQCAGNRRDGLHRVKHTKGVIWGPCAIGNGVYAGCRLKDVLESVGVTTDLPDIGRLHVSFKSIEQCEEDVCYGSSIPLTKALDPFGDVLLAYEMNGEPLTRDHGHPLRVVVPGYIGARSVKFLKSITIQDFESEAFYQRRDYKILPQHVEKEDQADLFWSKMPSIGEYNVQSYVCDPSDGLHSGQAKNQVVQGYALSGGGRSIQRVDVSGDDGKTWVEAILYQPAADGKSTHVWGWCTWIVRIDTVDNVRIVCRAVDSAGNIQQEQPVWNYRGVMNNSWRTADKRPDAVL
ncbi:Oxidoreductase, molybdopterin-binding domain-containing protein [Phycomyces nitens]|nr:Oxidoreductase, molybdopterin-binding domain-containing protein [Phycomyces nitens]